MLHYVIIIFLIFFTIYLDKFLGYYTNVVFKYYITQIKKGKI